MESTTTQQNEKTTKKNKLTTRVRVVNIMQYVKYTPISNVEYYVKNESNIECYAYTLHDKDVKADGTFKPPHFHLVIKYKNPATVSVIADKLRMDEQFVKFPKGKNSFLQCVQYLTHETPAEQKAGKYLYPDEEIFANFDFREMLDNYAKNNLFAGDKKSKKLQLRVKVFKGLPLSEIPEEDYVNDMQQLKACRREYLNTSAPMPKSRTNFYIRGGSGNGKTLSAKALAKSLIDPDNVMDDDDVFFTVGQGNAKFQGYDGQPVIIFDDMRGKDLISYYKSPGAIFNLFDVVPSKSEQNIKFGSVRLVNSISIVTSVQTFEEWSHQICFKVEQDEIQEPDKQLFRRFPVFININSAGATDNGSYDLFVNKQFFNPNEENYKAYLQFQNLGVRVGILEASHVERVKHFNLPSQVYKNVESKFNKQDQQELITSLDEEMLHNNNIIPTNYTIEPIPTTAKQRNEKRQELESQLAEIEIEEFMEEFKTQNPDATDRDARRYAENKYRKSNYWGN